MGGIMKMRKKLLGMLITLSAIWLLGGLGSVAHAKTLLTGTITSASGEKMEGVAVSARQIGKSFTTTVFTDASGVYYFPPLEEGKYKFWAQAITYDAAIVEDLDLTGPV